MTHEIRRSDSVVYRSLVFFYSSLEASLERSLPIVFRLRSDSGCHPSQDRLETENKRLTAFTAEQLQLSHEIFGNDAMHHLASWSIEWDELRILRKIGTGSFGEVSAAEWMKVKCAVKILLPARQSRETYFLVLAGTCGGGRTLLRKIFAYKYFFALSWRRRLRLRLLK